MYLEPNQGGQFFCFLLQRLIFLFLDHGFGLSNSNFLRWFQVDTNQDQTPKYSVALSNKLLHVEGSYISSSKRLRASIVHRKTTYYDRFFSRSVGSTLVSIVLLNDFAIDTSLGNCR